MRHLQGIDPKFPYLSDGGPIIPLINRVGEQEFSPALGNVDFKRHSGGRPYQNAVGTFFSHDQATFFNAEFAPKTTATTTTPRFPTLLISIKPPECLNSRHSYLNRSPTIPKKRYVVLRHRITT